MKDVNKRTFLLKVLKRNVSKILTITIEEEVISSFRFWIFGIVNVTLKYRFRLFDLLPTTFDYLIRWPAFSII